MAYEREREAALEAVRRASRLTRAVQTTLGAPGTLTKGDKSPVTVADFGAQAVVSATLAAAFPHIPLVGEEDAAELRRPENAELAARVTAHVQPVLQMSEEEVLAAIDRGTYPGGPEGAFWVLDPIDGTKGFLRGEQYAVAQGLVVDGEVVAGVLGCPNLPADLSAPDAGTRGALLSAVRGAGTRLHPLTGETSTPAAVRRAGSIADIVLVESVEKAHSDQSWSAKVAQRMGITAAAVRIDSQCKYATVARGDAGLYLRLPTRPGYVERIWDHAAGALVVTEAGGRVTDVDGKPLDFSRGRGLEGNRGIIASAGVGHDEALAAVQAAMAG
jgi:3'(2'), 5'-bisphosphate nucleotidase